LQYYTFPGLEAHPNLFHAVLTRHGGHSEGPWRSLNLGGSVGDDPQLVKRNRQQALQALKRHPDSVVDAWQVHGTKVLLAKTPRRDHSSQEQADIILTNRPDLTLIMRFADCVPIVLFDPDKMVVGLVHAGWQGTVKKAAYLAVDAMRKNYGTNSRHVLAGIGPSIGPDHYQVGADVIAQVHQSFRDNAHYLLHLQNGSVYFDLWKANEILLRQAGVDQIESSRLCTACNTADFYSHRAERGKTGRFGVVVGLCE
jgi:polyphenol oxidase